MSKTASSKTSLFSKRLREARLKFGIAQDKLGVMIGLDESCSSARISRYESGIHEPPFKMVQKIAIVLKLPTAYFFCEDDRLASILIMYESCCDSQKKAIYDFVIDLKPELINTL